MKTWVWWSLFVLSFFVVTFGQPAWNEWLGLLATFGGFACFWRVLLDIPSAKKRFFIAFVWFASVQFIQLSWFLSHPYLYIYGVTLACSFLAGIQWGILSIWITPKKKSRLSTLLGLAGLWVILEWSRLFWLSGLPFNPVGMAITGWIYPMQLASVGGIYLLSLWVILLNLLLLRAWMFPTTWKWTSAGAFALFPILFGAISVHVHDREMNLDPKNLQIVLVQPALPIEENMGFRSAEEMREFILSEWEHVLLTLQKQVGKKIDMIVFPEYLVPYGTHHFVYPLSEVIPLLKKVFENISYALPKEESSLIQLFGEGKEKEWWVSNAYLGQTVANLFNAHVVIGLEDSRYEKGRKEESFSSAFHFIPGSNQMPKRYDKRVLVPMGEYIPFAWCRTLAARYGISGSFTPGQSAMIFDGPIPFGASICYEEMYGNLMRENRMEGAELLVNLTNDGWYPNSRLPKQHFDHARLRTVENGIPLVRSCNTGITGAIDSLGRIVAVLGEDQWKGQETSDSLFVEVPLYHYQTLYSQFGDMPVLLLSCVFLLFGFISRERA